jgi:transcriptional regulator with XRE-family HTH domain
MPHPQAPLKKFGINVRSYREAQDLSQEQLAELADLDRTYISGIERGLRNLSLINISRLAEALEISVSDLCRGIDR